MGNLLSSKFCARLVGARPHGSMLGGSHADMSVQIFFQFKFFLPDPVENDVKYQASAQPFLVFGLLTTALAVGSTNAT
jgi:hypothetical protein